MSNNFEVEIEEQDATDIDQEIETASLVGGAVQEEEQQEGGSNGNDRPIFRIGEEPSSSIMMADENSNNSNVTAPASLAVEDLLAIESAETNNNNDGMDGSGSTALPPEPDTISLTPSEGADSTNIKPKVKTPSRAVLAADVTHVPLQPEDIVEYEWPQKSGDRFFLQEQISELLGISSFKRKYPEMYRRTVEPKERDYLLKELKIRIALPSHYQTALQSVDVHELMASEYPEIYADYQKACNERMKTAMLEKQKELDAIKMDEKKMAELRQKAIQNAFEFNAELQAVRRAERSQYWDLNTNIIHSPLNKWMRMRSEYTKPTKFPVFCLPGQYTDYYKKFTPSELRTLPLNTVLDGHNELFPPKKEHSPPPIRVTDEEVSAAAAKISKSAADEATTTTLVAAKLEPSTPAEQQIEPQETSSTATTGNAGGVEQQSPSRGLKRIKREPPPPSEMMANSPKATPPPSKQRKVSATNSSIEEQQEGGSNGNDRPIFRIGEEPSSSIMMADENSNNSNVTAPASLAVEDLLAIESAETNNNNDGMDGSGSTALPPEPDTISLTPSEGADSTNIKPKVKTPSRAVLAADVTHVPLQPEDIVEYEWPQKSGDRFFLQEQISELLGISSFKRKYPEMYRRTVEPKERDYLLKELKIRIALPSHYQTALQSVDVHELMASEYPEIYADYQKACNERMKTAMLEKQKELDAIKMDEKKMAELRQKAIQNAFEFNAELQAVRRAERSQYWDLNTNIIHSPLNKWMRMRSEYTKPTKFPVFCLPGQYTDYYKKFTPSELRTLPLNTVLDGHNELFPPKKEHSPPPIRVTDEEVSAAAAKISKSAADEATTTTLVAAKLEPSTPAEQQIEPQETSSTATTGNAGGVEQQSPSRGLKRIKREPPPPSEMMANSPKATPPPSKQRKVSATNSSNNGKRAKNSTGSRPSMTSKQPPPPSPKMPPIPTSPKQQPQSSSTSTTNPASTTTTAAAVCSICQLSEASPPQNKATSAAPLVHCSACHQQMHSSCIDMPLSMVQVIRQYDWLCIDCKRCCVCEQPDQEAAMMCCDQCDRGYHTFCIGLDQPPNGTWHCPECIKGIKISDKRQRKPKNFYLNLSGKGNFMFEESFVNEKKEEQKPTSSTNKQIQQKRGGPTKIMAPTDPPSNQ